MECVEFVVKLHGREGAYLAHWRNDAELLQQAQHVIFDPGLLHLAISDAILVNCLVTAVEERGYVERVPDPRDGRAKIVRLTERGQQAAQVGSDIIASIEREWAASLGSTDMDELRSLLERLVGALGRQQAR